jgi:fibronectin type 3 domain-containing protein
MSLRAFVLPAILVLFAACGDGDKPSSQPTPPQAPAAPANLIAVAGDGEVSLAWAPAAGAKSYNVYSGTASGVQPSATPAVTTTTPNATVTGLANDTEYFFVVTALNDVGEGRPSAEVSATPATGALGVPSGLIANPGDGQVGLSWNAVAGAESYAIFWATSAGVTQASASVSPVTGTTYAHTALTNDTTHYYRVAAVAGGATGALSSEVSATPTAGLLAAPANVSAAAGIGEVVVSWNPVPDATGYNLYWDTTGPVTTAANQVAGAIDTGPEVLGNDFQAVVPFKVAIVVVVFFKIIHVQHD